MRKTFLATVGPNAELHRDDRTGIAWIEDGSIGSSHSAHPNICATGSVSGMKKLGFWAKDARTKRTHGAIYNIDRLVVDSYYDELARRACRCGGNHWLSVLDKRDRHTVILRVWKTTDFRIGTVAGEEFLIFPDHTLHNKFVLCYTYYRGFLWEQKDLAFSESYPTNTPSPTLDHLKQHGYKFTVRKRNPFEVKNTEPVTPVVFRVWLDSGTMIALFPTLDEGDGYCSSYEPQTMHSSADYNGCIAASRPATSDEFAPLFKELTKIGYNLKINRRRPN